MSTVLVIAEGSGAALSSLARELIAAGRGLADAAGGRLALLVLGQAGASLAADAGACGVDALLCHAATDAVGYAPDQAAALALAAQAHADAGTLLLPHTPFGVDLAPRLAFRLRARWVPGCSALKPDGNTLLCTRGEVGGKVVARQAVAGPVVVTLRAKSVDAAQPGEGPAAACEAMTIDSVPTAGRIRFVQRDLEPGGGAAELEAAEVIVSGGLGLGGNAGFAPLRQLADAMGGVVGASKQAVDRGWIAADRQVGLTGTTVAPRLYIAVAISGAPQHMAGCQKSKAIVAINKDRDAPIFQYARYGIVGQWEEVVPALLASLGAN